LTFEDAVLKALEKGPGNPREITERLQNRVRETLNRLADDEKIERSGADGRGVEKIFQVTPRFRITSAFADMRL
jgi:hypothetical protein